MKTIIVDIMGGDNAPAETLKGACLAAQEIDANYILVGDRAQMEEIALKEGLSLESFEIVDTSVVITMEDEPSAVMRQKSDSSMAMGLRLLADGKGDAFVSTGNTGALYTGANLIVRRVKGVRRPAIGAILPMQPPVLLLDSGANIDVTPEILEQFAVMGATYMKEMMGVENPRVGLLNNGAEEHKGTVLYQEAYRLLSVNSSLNFVGNVEGNRAMFDTCDVLVADGFTGNIFLKTMEGMGKLMIKTLKGLFYKNLKTKLAALMVKSGIGEVKKNFDSTEFGGAPILGIAKPVIKAHGSSNAKAFKNAIRQAVACAEVDLSAEMSVSLTLLAEQKKKAKDAASDMDSAEN